MDVHNEISLVRHDNNTYLHVFDHFGRNEMDDDGIGSLKHAYVLS